MITLPARTVLVAAGTTPNITYEKEVPGTFQLDAKKKFFQPHRRRARTATAASISTPDPDGFFTSYDARRPVRHLLRRQPPALRRQRRQGDGVGEGRLSAGRRALRARAGGARSGAAGASATRRGRGWSRGSTTSSSRDVEDVVRLTPTIVEVIVKAPAAARHFQPGQFYRLQNYESVAPRRRGRSPLLMEGIALTGAWVDKERGLLSLIALELGVSSRLVAYLRKGEPVVVMGPTGAPTEIPEGQNVLLLGGGLGNAVLFSIAKAMREHGNRVIYFAGYKKGEDLFKREDIEAATDQVIWSTDIGAAIAPGRPQDAHFRGNIVQAMLAYQPASWATARAARHGRSHHRHRLGPDDGGGEGGAPRRAGAAPEAGPRRHRQHQLADAVHDEGSLRAVPAEARRSEDRQGVDHLLVLQPGSGDGPRRLPEPRRASAAEHRAGEARRTCGSITCCADSRSSTSEGGRV